MWVDLAFGRTVPNASLAASHLFEASPHRRLLSDVRFRATQAWTRPGIPSSTSDLAFDVRTSFLLRVLEGRIAVNYFAAGGPDDDATMQPATKVHTPPSTPAAQPAPTDPWLKSDPWQKKPKALFNTRWEDLVLPLVHPICDAKGGSLNQTHRLQASSRKAGVILATKGAIQDLVRLTFDAPTAIIMPASDKLAASDFGKKLSGPHELVLHDPTLQADYNRLIMMLPIFGEIHFKLPKPKITLTATEVVEIVAEGDARLLSPSELESAKQDPILFIKTNVGTIHPDIIGSLAFYALRTGRHPTAAKDEIQYQCIVKAARKDRKSPLGSSGKSPVLLRDFLDRAEQSSDMSVVPRFWPPSVRDLCQVRIIIKDVAGIAGLALTRRGLAARAWDSDIASVRRAVLPTDVRLTPDNLAVVPKVQYQSTGWPAAIEPASVVKCTLQAVGIAPVPKKAFRTQGVHGWILGFNSRPSTLRFTLEINSSTHEILLVEEDKSVKPRSTGRQQVKPFGKSNDIARQSTTATVRTEPPQAQRGSVSGGLSVDAQRLQILEDRFDKLEGRQARIEEKVDARFSEISTSLRQLLNASGIHQRESTGDTPAPKHPRHDASL